MNVTIPYRPEETLNPRFLDIKVRILKILENKKPKNQAFIDCVKLATNNSELMSCRTKHHKKP